MIEAVGVDAEAPGGEQFEQETGEVAPETNPQGDHWHPGGAPSQSAQWATEAVCKAGTIGVIGVFPPQAMTFVGLVATGALDPTEILTQKEPATGAIEAYETFDQRKPGWIKVELLPEAS